MTLLEETGARIHPLDAPAMAAMRGRLERLTKPPGSLGRLEELAIHLAGITGSADPIVDHKIIVVAAGDHGVAAEGVSAYPSAVTRQMLALFVAGRAAINVLARQVGAEVVVVDAGVAGAPIRKGGVVSLRIGPGTRNFRREPAMTRRQAAAAIEGGIVVAERAVEAGADLLVTGDMGIGNTTSAGAIVAACTNTKSAEIVGRGTGVDDRGLARKAKVIEDALALHHPDPADALAVLGTVGGFEIGVLAGVILAGAAAGRPVVLDGVASGAAALIACGLAPQARDFLIAGHCSTEPAHRQALAHLGLDPMLNLQLRLGEGTGAALALPLIDAAVAIARHMWTFEEAGVAQKRSEYSAG